MAVTDAEASYMDVNPLPTGGYVCTSCLEEWASLDEVPNGHRTSGACDAAVELAHLAGVARADQREADDQLDLLEAVTWPMYRPTRRDARPPRGPRSKTRLAAVPEPHAS